MAGDESALDPDASAYIANVEAADGQPLEAGVKDAINAFVVGCKADASPFAGVSNFQAIQASCIMMGARTLSGALVPFRGVAPTNFNFVAGDYSRSLGLLGNGTNKYLDSNRIDSADPQNNNHQSVFITSLPAPLNRNHFLIGAGFATGIQSHIADTTTGVGSRNRATLFTRPTPQTANAPSLVGISRSISSSYVQRSRQSNSTISATSGGAMNLSVYVFAANPGGIPSDTSAHRLACYSIGEAVDLAALDARITTLINAIASALA
jgi:hypothetical protein